MDIFGIFRRNKAPTANLAKERLKIIVEHSRADAKRPDFLNDMRREILAVVQKYIEIDLGDIDASINNMGETEMLELNILLPDTVAIEEKQKIDNQVKRAANQKREAADSDKVKASLAELNHLDDLDDLDLTELDVLESKIIKTEAESKTDKTAVKKTAQNIIKQRQQARTGKN